MSAGPDVERGLIIAAHAREAPERPAVIAPAGTRTFAELDRQANRLARALRRRGVRAGDAIAVFARNRPEFGAVYAAAMRAGLRLTPINWHLTGEEAGYILDDCEATAFVADAAFAEAAADAAARAPRVVARLAFGGDVPGFDRYEDALEAEDPGLIDDPSPGSTMLYTSGTTGRPKGVLRTDRSTVPPAALMSYLAYRPGDVHLCAGPLYHAAPLAYSLSIPLAAGVTVVLMEKWDAEEALRLIERHRVTHTHMVPTMFHRMLQVPPEVRAGFDVSSLRSVVHGAAPCPVAVKQAMIDWLGPVLWEYYAATEGSGTRVDSPTWLTKPGTVGKPNPADQVVVGDENGAPAPVGEVGIVWLKAPTGGRFSYFKDDQKTASSYRGDYFTLGDMGYFDADGFLFLTDRSANLIISGGVNIYPAEVDAVLLEHPAVADAATIGVPNDEWGEEVKAVVELRPGRQASPDLASELVAFCRGRLAHYKCPRSVDFVDTLPRQDNGKIYKRLLRDRYRDRAATTSSSVTTRGSTP